MNYNFFSGWRILIWQIGGNIIEHVQVNKIDGFNFVTW